MFEPNEFQVEEIKKCLGKSTLSAAELWDLVTTFDARDEFYRTLRVMVSYRHLGKKAEGYYLDETLTPIPFDDYSFKKATIESVYAPKKVEQEPVKETQPQVSEPEPETEQIHKPSHLLTQLLSLHSIPVPANVGQVHRLRDDERSTSAPTAPKLIKQNNQTFEDPFVEPKPVLANRAENSKIRQQRRVAQVNTALSVREDNSLFGFIQSSHRRESEVAYLLFELRNSRPISFKELILFTKCERVRLSTILKRLISTDYIQLVLTPEGEKQYRWKFAYCYPFQFRRFQDKLILRQEVRDHVRKLQQDLNYIPFPERPQIVHKEAAFEHSHSPAGDLKRAQRAGMVAYFFYSHRNGMAYHSREIISRLHLKIKDTTSILNKLVVRKYLDMEKINGIHYYSWSNRFSYPFANFDPADKTFFAETLVQVEEKDPAIVQVDNEIRALQSQLKRLEQKRELLESA